MTHSPEPEPRASGARPAATTRDAKSERRLGRGLESFSHLFFSSAEDRTGSSLAAAPDPDIASPIVASAPAPASATAMRPRSLFITGFRKGCGKTLLASAIARACRRASSEVIEWQLGAGVIVPRRGARFDLPIPHPTDRAAFDRFVSSAGRPDAVILDGPASLVEDGDSFALSAEEFLVVVTTGREGAAEGYAVVKEILGTLPTAMVRIVVNRAASQDEAGEVFHRIADVTGRHLRKTIRSFGGLPTLSVRETESSGTESESHALLFSRIARLLLATRDEPGAGPTYFERAWERSSAGRA